MQRKASGRCNDSLLSAHYVPGTTLKTFRELGGRYNFIPILQMGRLNHGKLDNLLKFTQLESGTETQQSKPRDSCQPPLSLILYFKAKHMTPPYTCDLRNSEQILCREISHRLAGPYKQTSYALDFYSSFISKSKYLNILQIESQLRKDFDKREYCPQVLYSRIDSFNYLLSATVYLKMWQALITE